MDRPVSATEGHFIRSHFAALKLSSTDWALPVTGEVDNPLKISYEGLLKMPSHEVISLMDCAGSSRSTMQPSAKGVQWDNGGLSVSRWKGVSVKTILEPASLKGSASNVLFVGADSGKEFHSDGTLVNEMNVPLEKLLHPDSILAYEMNGETLPIDHGFPICLLVPGWYGMTSVKWLTEMVVMDRPNCSFLGMDYRIYPATNGNGYAKTRRVTKLKVKSLISSPNKGDTVTTGTNKVTGVAWSDEGHITKVEVSTDDNRTWHTAKLEEPSGGYSWQHFEFDWEATSLGHALIRSRATNSAGNAQPMLGTRNFRGYEVNSIHSVPVTVEKP